MTGHSTGSTGSFVPRFMKSSGRNSATIPCACDDDPFFFAPATAARPASTPSSFPESVRITSASSERSNESSNLFASSNSSRSSATSQDYTPQAELTPRASLMAQEYSPAFLASSVVAATENESECPCCGESLLIRFGGEKTVTPVCGHRLHEECFEAVYGDLAKGRNPRKPLGVCGICRENILISDDPGGGGKNKFAMLSGIPQAGAADSQKMRSVTHRTLAIVEDLDRTQDDELFVPIDNQILSSVPLERSASSSRSSDSSLTRRMTHPSTSRSGSDLMAISGDWSIVRPSISVVSEYLSVARTVGKDKKQHLTCMVTIEVPSRWPTPISLQTSRKPSDPSVLSSRPTTGGSRTFDYNNRPSSPTDSSYSAFTTATSAYDIPPPVPSNPFASVVEDLHARMEDWKGHLPEFGQLKLFDYVNIRKDHREHEFLVYLFDEAILCVTDDKRKINPVVVSDRLRLKGRVFVKHIRTVDDTSRGADLSLTISMQDEGLDKFVIAFKDRQSLNVWRSQIELLLEAHRTGTPLSAPPPAPSTGKGRTFSGLTASTSTDSMRSDTSSSEGSSRRAGMRASSTYTRATNSTFPQFSPTIREEASIDLRRFNTVASKSFPTLIDSDAHLSALTRDYTPLDLMLILSIGTTKLQLNILKNSLHFLVQNVGPRTRISIVTYATGEEGRGDLRKTPFIAVGSADGPSRLEAIISRLGERVRVEAGMIEHKESSVHVVSAMNLALDIVLQRKVKSALTGIVLLNDGKDGGQKPQMDLVMTRAEASKVPIHSVGWGRNHDPSSLWLLSNRFGGTYTFVREYYDLRDALAGIVGGLLSIAATQVKLHLSVSELRTFRIRKVAGSSAVVSGTGGDVDVDLGEMRFGERKELLVEMEMTVEDPVEAECMPTVSSATDEYFIAKVGLNPMLLQDSEADFYHEAYEAMATDTPLFEVNLAYRDPALNKIISRLNPSPTVLTVNVVPASSISSPPVSDPTIIRRRMELLTSDMLNRTLLLMSRRNDAQAQRLLTETKRIITTINASFASPKKSGHRDSQAASIAYAQSVLAACMEDVSKVLEGCSNREDFEGQKVAAFAAQQAIVWANQRAWTPRSGTERLQWVADNSIWFFHRSQGWTTREF